LCRRVQPAEERDRKLKKEEWALAGRTEWRKLRSRQMQREKEGQRTEDDKGTTN